MAWQVRILHSLEEARWSAQEEASRHQAQNLKRQQDTIDELTHSLETATSRLSAAQMELRESRISPESAHYQPDDRELDVDITSAAMRV